MIKLVAFDWNGTLLADSRLAAAGDIHAISPFTGKKITLKDMQSHFTIPILDYLQAMGLDKNKFLNHYEKINKDFNDYYEARVNRCRTRSGVREVLIFSKRKGISNIIYSNHVTAYIHMQLKRLKIEGYFDAVLARAEDDRSHMHSRGKQQKLYDYARNHKFKPREIVSVGDTEEEIEIGKQYGYHTVGITGGYNSTARLKKQNPDFLIHNMKQLVPVIKKLNQH